MDAKDRIALLKTSTAAEIAKRFNATDDVTGVPSTRTEAASSQRSLRDAPRGVTATGPDDAAPEGTTARRVEPLRPGAGTAGTDQGTAGPGSDARAVVRDGLSPRGVTARAPEPFGAEGIETPRPEIPASSQAGSGRGIGPGRFATPDRDQLPMAAPPLSGSAPHKDLMGRAAMAAGAPSSAEQGTSAHDGAVRRGPAAPGTAVTARVDGAAPERLPGETRADARPLPDRAAPALSPAAGLTPPTAHPGSGQAASPLPEMPSGTPHGQQTERREPRTGFKAGPEPSTVTAPSAQTQLTEATRAEAARPGARTSGDGASARWRDAVRLSDGGPQMLQVPQLSAKGHRQVGAAPTPPVATETAPTMASTSPETPEQATARVAVLPGGARDFLAILDQVTPRGDAEPVLEAPQVKRIVAALDALVPTPDWTISAPAQSVGAAVIYNAAMIPGWPFREAFASDPVAAVKAARPEIVMTPEDMAEYLARVAARLAVLRRVREDMDAAFDAEGEGVLGLLRAVLDTVIEGLRLSLSMGREQLGMIPAGAPRDTRRRFTL